MAVAPDAASSGVALAGVTSASWSHTASGSDRGVVVGIGAGSGGTPTVTSITYGGAGMTLVPSGTLHDANGQDVWLYRLIAPATGSQTVSVTFSIAVYGACGSVSVTGADQTTMTGTAVTGTAASGTTSPALVVASAVGDLVIDTIKKWNGNASSPGVGAGQTQRWVGSDGSFNEYGACSTEPGAASVTMTWTDTFTPAWTGVAVNIIASGGAAAPDPPRQRMVRPPAPVPSRW